MNKIISNKTRVELTKEEITTILCKHLQLDEKSKLCIYVNGSVISTPVLFSLWHEDTSIKELGV